MPSLALVTAGQRKGAESRPVKSGLSRLPLVGPPATGVHTTAAARCPIRLSVFRKLLAKCAALRGLTSVATLVEQVAHHRASEALVVD